MVWTTILIVFGAIALALVVMGFELGEGANPADAEVAALDAVGDGVTQVPRRDGDRWEVDVVRHDGSMVQVILSKSLHVLDMDEEVGPAGTLAADEATGRDRVRAVRATFEEIGPGVVIGVEREPGGEFEVGVLQRGGQVEVELDRNFRVTEVEGEDPRDE
ncbi:MAG TPA: hypothetical protein VG126_01230 [Thermoleophilaceae bacterium]|nr:hypothetical protein [Thermoleophilaceae bacterium]